LAAGDTRTRLNVRWMPAIPSRNVNLYPPLRGILLVVVGRGVRWWHLWSIRGRRWRVALPLMAGVVAALACFALSREVATGGITELYTATLAVSPDAYYMHNIWGTVYWRPGTTWQQKGMAHRPYQLAPGSEYVLHNLGLATNAEKRYGEAGSLFLRALAIARIYGDAHLDLGETTSLPAGWRKRGPASYRRRSCPPSAFERTTP